MSRIIWEKSKIQSIFFDLGNQKESFASKYQGLEDDCQWVYFFFGVAIFIGCGCWSKCQASCLAKGPIMFDPNIWYRPAAPPPRHGHGPIPGPGPRRPCGNGRDLLYVCM